MSEQISEHFTSLQDSATPKGIVGQPLELKNQLSTMPRHSNAEVHDTWRAYWRARGQSWRTEPEIDNERQKALEKQRTITTDIKQGIYPFRNIKLTRADVEWLLATHEGGNGPVDWDNKSQRERLGLDLRGADLRHVDLSGLPLTFLQGGLAASDWLFATDEQRDTAAIQLEEASLISAHLERAVLSAAHLEGAVLEFARLEGANFIGAHLEGAYLVGTHLEQADLFKAHLEGAILNSAHLDEANFIDAYLQGANLERAHLEGANLERAHLEGANLEAAHLEGANLEAAHLEGTKVATGDLKYVQRWYWSGRGETDRLKVLPPANLQQVSFDSATNLQGIILGSKEHGFVSLVDVHWNDVNLAAVNWRLVKILGDECEAQKSKNWEGKTKDKNTRLNEYEIAVRANRQITIVLQRQGLNEQATHFAYRAQVLQQEVLRRQRKFGQYLFSLLLDLLAGYGYKPVRLLVAYLIIIAAFATGYYKLTHLLHTQLYPLAWYEALLLSVISFHGQGFFQSVQSLGDPVVMLAIVEAIFGLALEISFIATFVQRFFGK